MKFIAVTEYEVPESVDLGIKDVQASIMAQELMTDVTVRIISLGELN